MKTAVEEKAKSKAKPNLRVVSVDFVETPGAERKLARVYEILLAPRKKDNNER